MLVVEHLITMSDLEWSQFQEMTRAPWRPRTIDEFNAMCDLGSAVHLAEDTMSMGTVFAENTQRIKFGQDGQANFPADRRKLAYIEKYGHSPTNEQMEEFNRGDSPQRPGLSLVKPSN
ncbi:MAG: hypothetical protein ACD_23C00750G0001 [uncultured bacterium]|nr:MAG: hypothetical protein ACD_23C00750G0001 [uncultured bacterium]